MDLRKIKNNIDDSKKENEFTVNKRGCSIEQLKVFAKLAKAVVVDGKNERELADYLAKHLQVKQMFLRVYTLLEKTNSASIALIQRRLHIGYYKAGVIVETLEEMGIVTPFDGINARRVIRERLFALKTFLK